MMTTSYKSEGLQELLECLPLVVGAQKIIEFGTQHGHSAVLLGMSGAKVYTYDSFMQKYPTFPYKDTHASYDDAVSNTRPFKNIKIIKQDVFSLKPTKCDILHIDICNHKANVQPLIDKWQNKVSKMIILEGGVLNNWQKKYGFVPFDPSTDMDLLNWDYIILKGKDGYAMTILTRI